MSDSLIPVRFSCKNAIASSRTRIAPSLSAFSSTDTAFFKVRPPDMRLLHAATRLAMSNCWAAEKSVSLSVSSRTVVAQYMNSSSASFVPLSNFANTYSCKKTKEKTFEFVFNMSDASAQISWWFSLEKWMNFRRSATLQNNIVPARYHQPKERQKSQAAPWALHDWRKTARRPCSKRQNWHQSAPCTSSSSPWRNPSLPVLACCPPWPPSPPVTMRIASLPLNLVARTNTLFKKNLWKYFTDEKQSLEYFWLYKIWLTCSACTGMLATQRPDGKVLYRSWMPITILHQKRCPRRATLTGSSLEDSRQLTAEDPNRSRQLIPIDSGIPESRLPDCSATHGRRHGANRETELHLRPDDQHVPGVAEQRLQGLVGDEIVLREEVVVGLEVPVGATAHAIDDDVVTFTVVDEAENRKHAIVLYSFFSW